MLPTGSSRVRRVVYEDDPREADYLAALNEVREIRTELSHLRSRLRDLSKVETPMWSDSLSVEVAGTMTLAIIALHTLEIGDRSFAQKARRSRELWADVGANPDDYVVKEGKR